MVGRGSKGRRPLWVLLQRLVGGAHRALERTQVSRTFPDFPYFLQFSENFFLLDSAYLNEILVNPSEGTVKAVRRTRPSELMDDSR